MVRRTDIAILVVGIGVEVVVTILGIIMTTLPMPITIVWLIVGGGMIIWGVVAICGLIFQWPLRRLGQSTTNGQSKEIDWKTTIRAWIDISAWKVQKQDITDSLAYKIELGSAHVHIIIQNRKPQEVNLVSRLSLASPALSRDDLSKSCGQIRRELNQLHIQHRFFPDSSDLEIVHYVILDKDITEYVFREKIMDVFRAIGSVIELQREAIRQSGEKKLNLDKEGFQPE